MRIFERTLDQAKSALNLSENGILQGNVNVQLVIKLAENEKPLTIDKCEQSGSFAWAVTIVGILIMIIIALL